MRRFWMWFLARFRLSKWAVCEMSREGRDYDYHDYPDSIEGQPWHMVELECKRCGKKFFV